MPDGNSNWWHSFFDDRYADFGLGTDTEEARERCARTADFLREVMKLEDGATVFDQCCGLGRISIALANSGIECIGVDQSLDYVRRAEAEAASLPCTFHQGDAFSFVPDHPCDGAINWFTSFGYLADDDANVQMARRAFESLKSGGVFVVDYMSLPRVLSRFQPYFVQRFEGGGEEQLLIIETRIDFIRGMISSHWTFQRPGERDDTRLVENRAYMPWELVALLGSCGFERPRLYGAITGEEYSRESPRLIVAVEKP